MSEHLIIRPAMPHAAELRAVYDMLKGMFDESPMEPLSPLRAAVEIERVVRDEAAWVVYDGDLLVATMGLARAEFWYSDVPIIATRWLYALPAYRGDGSAWGLMLSEAKELARLTGQTAWLDVFNPAKPRHANRLQQGFARFAFEPRGQRLSISNQGSTA